LKPRRTQAGYRLYGLGDLERLEQIVALKFLGIPLKQIRTLFHCEAHALTRSAAHAAPGARGETAAPWTAPSVKEQATRPGERPDSAVLRKIIEVIEMQDNMGWSKKYFSDEAQTKIEERKQLWSPENRERWSKEWSDLFREVEAALGENPAGEKARALAARWKKLVEVFTGRDPQITAGLKKMYQDRPNWPVSMQQRMQPFSSKQVWEFIQKAFAAGKA